MNFFNKIFPNRFSYRNYATKKITHLHMINGKMFDVNKIMSIYYRRRLFCITDIDKPFVLEFTYDEPHFKITPVSYSKYHKSYDLIPVDHKFYSFRYESEEDCENEISVIRQKQKQILSKYK